MGRGLSREVLLDHPCCSGVPMPAVSISASSWPLTAYPPHPSRTRIPKAAARVPSTLGQLLACPPPPGLEGAVCIVFGEYLRQRPLLVAEGVL